MSLRAGLAEAESLVAPPRLGATRQESARLGRSACRVSRVASRSSATRRDSANPGSVWACVSVRHVRALVCVYHAGAVMTHSCIVEGTEFRHVGAERAPCHSG